MDTARHSTQPVKPRNGMPPPPFDPPQPLLSDRACGWVCPCLRCLAVPASGAVSLHAAEPIDPTDSTDAAEAESVLSDRCTTRVFPCTTSRNAQREVPHMPVPGVVTGLPLEGAMMWTDERLRQLKRDLKCSHEETGGVGGEGFCCGAAGGSFLWRRRCECCCCWW